MSTRQKIFDKVGALASSGREDWAFKAIAILMTGDIPINRGILMICSEDEGIVRYVALAVMYKMCLDMGDDGKPKAEFALFFLRNATRGIAEEDGSELEFLEEILEYVPTLRGVLTEALDGVGAIEHRSLH